MNDMVDQNTVARMVNGLGTAGKSIHELSTELGMPYWRVNHVLKRLEKLGFVRSRDEVKFSAGRPRKLYFLTDDGVKYFLESGVLSLRVE